MSTDFQFSTEHNHAQPYTVWCDDLRVISVNMQYETITPKIDTVYFANGTVNNYYDFASTSRYTV